MTLQHVRWIVFNEKDNLMPRKELFLIRKFIWVSNLVRVGALEGCVADVSK